jgi:hypothetical protein
MNRPPNRLLDEILRREAARDGRAGGKDPSRTKRPPVPETGQAAGQDGKRAWAKYRAAYRAAYQQSLDEELARGTPKEAAESRASGVAAFQARPYSPEAKALLYAAPWDPPVPLNDAPAAAPFPSGVLPRLVGRFVEEWRWALNCPPDFVAVPALVVAGAAIGNSRRLAITQSHTQSACLFAFTVGDPGSGKSPVLEAAVEPLEQADWRYQEGWKEEVADWEKRDPKTRGARPVLRRCLVDDSTTEKLAAILEGNPRGLAMVRDELAALVCGMNQYKAGGRGHDRQVYLKLWASATILVDRKNNDSAAPLRVRRPFVAIVGGIQPAVVGRLRGEAGRGQTPADDGLLDRFLPSFPAEVPAEKEQWKVVSKEARDGWRDVIDLLLGLDMERSAAGDAEPRLVRLTACGRDAWVAFTEAHAAELNAEDFPPCLRGAWSKLRGYCCRLALVVHYLRWACQEVKDEDVDGESVRRAAALVAYFKSHTRKVYAAFDADPKVADARRVLRCLSRHPELDHFTRADLYQHVRRHFGRPDALDGTLRLLVDQRHLRVALPDGDGRPGPRTERYQRNPLWDGGEDPSGGELEDLQDFLDGSGTTGRG